VDAMISVVEPGMRSVQTAARIHQLAGQIGIERTFVVANKISREDEREKLGRALSGQIIIGTLPYDAGLARADLEGRPVDLENPAFRQAIDRIGEALQEKCSC